MGAANVSAAFTTYPDLPHRAFRLLAYMALVSLDRDRPDMPARVCWIGREALADALGFCLPPEPDTDDDSEEASDARTRRHSSFMTLGKVLRELVAAGAVTHTRRGGRNQTAEYVLNLDAFSQARRSGVPSELRSGVPKGLRSGVPKGQRSGVPKENRGDTEEDQGGEPIARRTSHLAGIDPVDQGEIDRGVLARLGPDQQQRYLEAAHREGVTDTAAMVARAVELAQVDDARTTRIRDAMRRKITETAAAS